MKLFRYMQDSHDSWDCLSQLADIHPNTIMGTTNNKPNLECLGYTMEIITACRNGKINKPRFNLKSYTNTIVHNEMLDKKEEEKKKLRLIDREELTEQKHVLRGMVYEGSTALPVQEDNRVIEEVTKEACYNELKQSSKFYFRKYGVDILRLVEMAEHGYERAITKLDEIIKKDGTLSRIVHEILTESRSASL